MPTAQEATNLALVRRYFDEIMNGGNPAAIDELIASDCVFTIPTLPDPFYGPDGYRKLVALLRTAFPDLLFKVEDELAEGDVVVDRWTATGTSKGPFNGAPPSGRTFRIDGIGWYRLKDGKFIENRVNEDTIGLLTQIGILPETGTPEANIALVQRFWQEIWNQGKLDVADQVVSPDFVLHLPGRELRGPAGLKEWASTIRGGLPDVQFDIVQIVAQADQVATRWNATGTNTLALMGIPPTGKKISMAGISLFRLANGRIAEDYASDDTLGLLQQLGVVPPPGGAPAAAPSASAAEGKPQALVLMPGDGDALTALGSTLTVKVHGRDTGGLWSLSHITVPANFVQAAPPPHYHTRDEEGFYVLEGTITFQIEGKDVRAPAGSFVKMPRNLVHKFSNPDTTPAAVLVIGSPSGIEDYLVEIYQLLQVPGPPDLRKMNDIFEKYGMHIVGAPPPAGG